VNARRAVHGLLFDKDGTLIDFDATWAPVIRAIVEDMCPERDPDELIVAAGFDRLTGRFQAGSIWAAGSTRDLVQLWWPLADSEQSLNLASRIDATCARLGPRTAVPLLDIDAFLNALSARGLTLGIATNDSHASLTAFLDAYDFAGRLTHAFGYDSVENPKPAPDMMLAFCSAAGLSPDQVAVVGDNTHDLEMARAAGAGWAIGVLTGNGSREDLEPLADILLDNVGDVVGWLEASQ
jgi:phosphoglycolate phosphatase